MKRTITGCLLIIIGYVASRFLEGSLSSELSSDYPAWYYRMLGVLLLMWLLTGGVVSLGLVLGKIFIGDTHSLLGIFLSKIA